MNIISKRRIKQMYSAFYIEHSGEEPKYAVCRIMEHTGREVDVILGLYECTDDSKDPHADEVYMLFDGIAELMRMLPTGTTKAAAKECARNYPEQFVLINVVEFMNDEMFDSKHTSEPQHENVYEFVVKEVYRKTYVVKAHSAYEARNKIAAGRSEDMSCIKTEFVGNTIVDWK